MTGALRIKNGIYQMRFSWKDSTGKWRRKEETTRLAAKGNKRAAEAMLKKRLVELETLIASGAPVQSPIFLEEMERWLDVVVVHDVRSNTLHQYKAVFRKHIKTYLPFQKLLISNLTAKLLQEYINEKASYLSAETVHKHFANLHKFLDYMWRLDVISYNPADKVKLPKKNRQQRGSTYTVTQLQQLFDLFKSDPLELAIHIASTYGIRRSELCGLKWDAVDLERGYLTICHTAIVDCGRVIYSDNTKSQSSRRRLPITPHIRELLKAEQMRQQENREKLHNAYRDWGYVCCWADGSPILPEYLSAHYRKVLKSSDLPFIQFRNLRDTVATLLHESGHDVKSIQGWLGHSDPSTTAKYYVHFQDADMMRMAQTMEQIFHL